MDGKLAHSLIKTAKARMVKEGEVWRRYRRWYKADDPNGSEEDNPTGSSEITEYEEITLETNYPYAYVDTMVANVCPPNPQLTLHAKKDELKDAAFAREALTNSVLRECKAHSKFWEIATRASIFGRCWSKVIWNHKKARPQIKRIDPQYVFFDQDAEDFEDIGWLIEVTTVKQREFKKKRKNGKKQGLTYNQNVVKKMNWTGYPQWLLDISKASNEYQADIRESFKWTTIYEVYDFLEGTYAQYVDNVEEPLMKQNSLPYKYMGNPYTLVTFNDNLEDLAGLSDVKLIARLQERLNELDTLELQHIQASIPAVVLNTGLVDKPEGALTALQNSSYPGAVLRINGIEKAPLRDILGQTPTPQISPNWNQLRDRIVQTIEFILGLPQYQRGVVGVADVATEVALADTATRTRNGRRVKVVQDLGADVGMKIIALYEEYLEKDTRLRVRIHESTKSVLVDREALAFPEVGADAKESSQQWYEFDAVAYSPTENHKVNVLNQIRELAPLLQNSPLVDQVQLMKKILRLLDMPNAFVEPQQAPNAQLPGGIDPETGTPLGGVPPMGGSGPDGRGMVPSSGPLAGDAGAIPQAGADTIPGTPVLAGTNVLPNMLRN